MATTVSDAKRLWGRAGGRCSICRKELSAIGGAEVLGHMAHIVAREPEGPRGEESLTLEQRDSYSNLILLCGNHHGEIDSYPDKWSVSRLHEAKGNHEDWVHRLLDENRIFQLPMDGPSFVNERVEQWQSDSIPWYFVSLTPLEVVDDAIDPYATGAVEILSELDLPRPLKLAYGGEPARYIEPSSSGVVLEYSRKLNQEVGHRLELFRTGHVEFLATLESVIRGELSSRYFREDHNELDRPFGLQDHRRHEFDRCLAWKELSRLLWGQLEWVYKLWHDAPLPASDMVATLALTKVAGATLLVPGDPRDAVGRPHELDTLCFSCVVDRVYSLDEIADLMFRRCAESFGFLLGRARNDEGELQSPALPNG